MRANVLCSFLLLPLCWAKCPTDTICEERFDRCYKFVNQEIDWFSAEDTCASLGGHLVSIRSAFEGARVGETAKSMFVGLPDYWIGANHIITSVWSWTDGSQWGYTNWFPDGDSNEGAVYAFTSSNLWSASAEGLSKPFVCGLPYVDQTTTQCPVCQTCPTKPAPTQCPVCPSAAPKVTCPTTSAPTPAPKEALCEEGWMYFHESKSCYKVFHNQVFASAEQTCVKYGAHLASIHSLTENNFISDFATTGLSSLSGAAFTWIGLHKVFDVWQWTDGTPVRYTNWAAGEPTNSNGDEACVQLYSDACSAKQPCYQKWNDTPCGSQMRALVCKKPVS